MSLSLISPTKGIVIGFLLFGLIDVTFTAIGKVYEIATADKHAAQVGVYMAKTLREDEDVKELLVDKKKFNKKKIINVKVKDAK